MQRLLGASSTASWSRHHRLGVKRSPALLLSSRPPRSQRQPPRRRQSSRATSPCRSSRAKTTASRACRERSGGREGGSRRRRDPLPPLPPPVAPGAATGCCAALEQGSASLGMGHGTPGLLPARPVQVQRLHPERQRPAVHRPQAGHRRGARPGTDVRGRLVGRDHRLLRAAL